MLSHPTQSNGHLQWATIEPGSAIYRLGFPINAMEDPPLVESRFDSQDGEPAFDYGYLINQ